MVKEAVSCSLCGLPTYHPIHDDAGVAYCCPACREVSALLATDEAKPNSAPIASDLANAATASISLGGLWCPSCSWLIEESLQRANGVLDAEVNFIQREARIIYDPEIIDPKQAAKRVRRLGYRAWLPDERPYDEEEGMWNRLLINGLLVMQIMMMSFFIYGRDWLGLSSPETEWLTDFFNIILFVTSIPVMLMLGLPILRAGMASLIRGRPNIHTLIALGAFSAFALSVYHLWLGEGRVYFDTAAILLFLVSVGRWLEMRAQKTSSEAVERLYEKMPDEAVLVTPEGERRVPTHELQPGARVRVRPGERFPVDGIVAAGGGDVDESLLTGEPEPMARGVGDRVMAGTVSLDGGFEVIASAVGAETVAGQIGRLLHQALWQQAPIQRLADRLAAWMVPSATVLALLALGYWTYAVDFERGLIVALSVLLIACPCALGIATPLTLWLSVGRAARAGAILRNAGALERLASVTRAVFDKTGTLTRLPIRLQAMVAEEMDETEFWRRVAAAESFSEHPLAQAVVAGVARPTSAAREEQHHTRARSSSTETEEASPSLPQVSDFRALPGKGVTARVEGEQVWVGSRRLMVEQELTFPSSIEMKARAWQDAGFTVVYAGWNGRVRGALALGEDLRPEAEEALAELKALGLTVSALTGDDAAAGRRYEALLGIPVLAEQRPEDKLAYLEAAGEGALMVGDGINDGPALAAADVGVAVLHGADVARAAADAVLLNDDLRLVPWLVRLSRVTMRKVRQNLAWAFVYNIFGLGLAVSGHLQPAIAALLMVLSNLVVTTNALRLRRFDPDRWQLPDEEEPSSPGAALSPAPSKG
ncbi:MAG: cation-translocating P-type ATPase [Chloroflexi bacterium]|nr:cation-translocating P-type ATPase [Chloroflexota bacterium]